MWPSASVKGCNVTRAIGYLFNVRATDESGLMSLYQFLWRIFPPGADVFRGTRKPKDKMRACCQGALAVGGEKRRSLGRMSEARRRPPEDLRNMVANKRAFYSRIQAPHIPAAR